MGLLPLEVHHLCSLLVLIYCFLPLLSEEGDPQLISKVTNVAKEIVCTLIIGKVGSQWFIPWVDWWKLPDPLLVKLFLMREKLPASAEALGPQPILLQPDDQMRC